MHRELLAIAAASLAATAIPTAASAQHRAFVGNPPERIDQGRGALPFRSDLCRDRRDRNGDRQRRDFCRSDVVMDWYGGEWALYNNRSWNSDSYNDWWHDQPWRAYPAWTRHNQDCQRQWFS